MCATAAPALAASTAAVRDLRFGVTGSSGWIPAVSPAPVTAQLTMTSLFTVPAFGPMSNGT